MITEIEITNLRGIRGGRLEGLKPLTILTGPNACGKSTVLDALLIGASPRPEDAVGLAVQRHPVALGGARWLFGPGGDRAELAFATTSWPSWRQLLVRREHCDEDLRQRLHERHLRPPFSMITFERTGPLRSTNNGRMAFGVENQFESAGNSREEVSPLPFVQMVDPGLPIPLQQTFTAVSRTGRRDDVYALLSVLVPDFERLEILVEEDDTPSLYLTSAGRSVPVALAGDGVQAFVQLALEVAVAPEGLVLVEEPEVYQHPKAIWQTARVLVANMRRGVQIVVTTHSLELIDAFLAEATDEDLEKLALFNLLLEAGKLVNARRCGEEIAFARQTLENDLR